MLPTFFPSSTLGRLQRFRYFCLGTLLCALTLGVAPSTGQTPQETKPSSDDRIVALEKELSAVTQRLKKMERVAGHQDKQKAFAYSLADHDAIVIQPILERLLRRPFVSGCRSALTRVPIAS
ncbi:hypothetical protein NZK35_11775 [Stieleria sp. ICT_E10.1]|nr:hypothetical protein [Stieleria sedimenti]